jgi:hypothetical protein
LERLENIQKSSMEEVGVVEFPRGRPDAYLRFIAQSHKSTPDIEKHYQEWEKIYPLSRYQNKISFLQVCEIFNGLNEIVKGLKDKAILDKEIPVFGTLPQLSFAACVTFQEAEVDEIVLISEGLLVFSRAISHIFARMIHCANQQSQNIVPILEFIDEDTKSKFFQLFFVYYASKSSSHSLLNDLSPDIAEISALSFEVSDVFRCFAIAHEYAHYLLDHTGAYRYDGRIRREKNLSVVKERLMDPEQAVDWALELEADQLGAMLCIEHCQSFGIPDMSIMAGILLCVKSIESLENLDIFFDAEEDASHPPASMRIAKLRKIYPLYVSLFDAIDEAFCVLWKDFFTLKFRRIAKLYSELDFSKIGNALLIGIAEDDLLMVPQVEFESGQVMRKSENEPRPLLTEIGQDPHCRRAIVQNNIGRIYHRMGMTAHARQCLSKSASVANRVELSALQKQVIYENHLRLIE